MPKPELRRVQLYRNFLLVVMSCLIVINTGGCARLPYTTTLVHEDLLVEVKLQQEVTSAGYTHPARLTAEEVASILKGFSLRPQKNVPVRWFGEEAPPKPVFREDEILTLSSWLAAGLLAANAEERVHFALFAPGMNPSNERDVTAGWVAIREPYFYITVEYFHAQVPLRKSDQYDYNYPTPPPLGGSYLLYFEPGRFWLSDPNGERGLEYRKFLTTAPLRRTGSP
ncbi:MAG: hypothetical protein OEV08_05325 [Nitrospira sp.]|nr:hypothetical protein [Nitrospira sp.]